MGLLDFLKRNRETDSSPVREDVSSASEQSGDRPDGAEISYLDSEALRFWAKKTTDYDIPPYYSQSEFGRNVLPALHRLLDGGYLEISDIETNISLKTIPDLKAILAEHELKTTGKKGELVQRILNNIPVEELEAIFPVGKYELTEKGKAALVPYEVFDINKRYSLGISHYRLVRKKNENPNASPEELIKSLLEEDIKTCYRENDRARYPAVLSNSATFLQSIGEYENSLACSCLAFFMWTRRVDTLLGDSATVQNYYMAKHLEEKGQSMGLSLEQLLSFFKRTISSENPFGLATAENVRYALGALTDALSIK